MKKVRWGILSTANIGVKKVIPAMQKSSYCDIVAIASQNAKKARAAADQLGIPHAYSTYEELLADTEVEAVYIPLPNHLHVDWCIKALEAGKHVLCEKPISLTSADAQRLLDVSKNYPDYKLMEAFMYRQHPQWKKALQLVDDGEIGTLQTIQSFFSYYNVDSTNIRNIAEAGGGGLMDIGCYCISLSRFIFGTEPQRVFGAMQYDSTFKTDYLTSGILDFANGTSTFTCSTQLAPYQRVNILGTKGRIEIEIPFNAPPDAPCRLWLQRGSETQEIIFDICDQYTLQADAFSLAVLNNTDVPVSLEDAICNMQVIENIVNSAQRGTWV
ncbi:Gfo/Idh/MocA family protein [Desulfosediminicola flagellatus]|uniref:Gfo/Idh/MocA family protein n=1 Tax=Desulfosediminicola flagellatus TaxID=2569541 RepID=UPI0010AD7B62|nr:Gfo/Idh/MocA family oxidoreductase [Desulfosediminicola flagellatus]